MFVIHMVVMLGLSCRKRKERKISENFFFLPQGGERIICHGWSVHTYLRRHHREKQSDCSPLLSNLDISLSANLGSSKPLILL